MKILIIDAQNFLHRARSGFTSGEYSVVFNFFRNLRALVEKHSPQKVYFVLEGHPQQRLDEFPEYKANRKLDYSSQDPKVIKKIEEMKNFFRQVDLINSLLKEYFPISVVRHPRFECDDTIYNLIKGSSTEINWIVASNDSDFTQLLNEFDNVKVYNPMTKEYFKKPDYCYVAWKALRGDGSDNIPGLPRIGDKTAIDLLSDPDKLCALFKDKVLAEQYSRNYNLIKFHSWVDSDANEMTCSSPTKNWEKVFEMFENWEFKSLLKEGTWKKFVDTFDMLFS